MAQPDPLLPDLDPLSPVAVEAASVARELVTAYLGHSAGPEVLRFTLRTALGDLYDGLNPTMLHTQRASALLCSMAALLQVALSSVGQLASDGEGDDIDVAVVFEQLAASAVDDGLTF
jgi:hypothetical protein